MSRKLDGLGPRQTWPGRLLRLMARGRQRPETGSVLPLEPINLNRWTRTRTRIWDRPADPSPQPPMEMRALSWRRAVSGMTAPAVQMAMKCAGRTTESAPACVGLERLVSASERPVKVSESQSLFIFVDTGRAHTYVQYSKIRHKKVRNGPV